MKVHPKLLKYVLCLTLFCGVQYAFSQDSVNKQYQNWTQYFFSVRLNEHLSVSADALYRWKDIGGQKFQSGIRGSLSYQPKEPVVFTAGYVYFAHYPTDKNVTVTRHEHRPWQQVMLTGKMKRFQIQHRYRLEERFVEKATGAVYTGGYGFNFRARYQLNLQYPFNKKEILPGTLYGLAFNEIFVNFGKEIVYNYFDQNRTAIGLGLQVSKSFGITAAYQYIWQQRALHSAGIHSYD